MTWGRLRRDGRPLRSDHLATGNAPAGRAARHDRELTAITEELATADLAGSRRLLLARARLNLDAERPGLALADAQRVLGSYPEGRPVPALVYVTLAQAAFAAGDPLAAKGWAETGASVASGGGYMAAWRTWLGSAMSPPAPQASALPSSRVCLRTALEAGRAVSGRRAPCSAGPKGACGQTGAWPTGPTTSR